jgi:hypothetical protein
LHYNDTDNYFLNKNKSGGNKMSERRTGMDRRSGRDRRNGGTSSYNGPERRSLRYRRSDTDRRKK